MLTLRQAVLRAAEGGLLVVPDADLAAGRGEGIPADVEPAAAGSQQLVGLRMGAQEVDEALELL